MKKKRLILILISVLILLLCIGMTFFLLFSNYQNVRLFKQAQSNFLQGDDASLSLAESQLLQIISSDSENETAFVMLGEIARKKKIYPEQVYYCFMAYRLNPLSRENREKYISSLCYARYFDRLEMFLSQVSSPDDKQKQLLLYAAGRNKNIKKYKQLAKKDRDHGIGELASILFLEQMPDDRKLAALENFSGNDVFLRQEILTAQTDLYLNQQNIDRAETCLQQAYELNRYAFASALGRFYADYRGLGKALEIFEEHLSVYHDLSVAVQAAEIYCLLNRTEKIIKLRTDYQSDSGARAMLSNYYFDALIALAKGDMAGLKDLTVPLRNNIDTPLSAFMFFCVDVQGNDPALVQESYNALLAHRNYLNLQEQADRILSEYLMRSFRDEKSDRGILLSIAKTLYSRAPDVLKAKFILLSQKKSDSVNIVLLKDALERFGNDQGLVKIAIEYYLRHDPAEAERLISGYKQKFARRAGDMLRYEIILNMQKKDFDKVSGLFRKNFASGLLSEYWNFASTTMREEDLRFLSRDPLYEPFCKALLLIKQGSTEQACDLLEKADSGNQPALLFFAAKTLAENGRNHAALRKYEQFPQESSYRIPVLLNMAELHAEIGNLDQALILSGRAYHLAPQMPETQLCHADKLFRKGNLTTIPDVIKISSSDVFRNRMKPLWVAGMQQRIKDCDLNTQREKIRELCRKLLVISPDNNIALEYLKKLHRMPQ